MNKTLSTVILTSSLSLLACSSEAPVQPSPQPVELEVTLAAPVVFVQYAHSAKGEYVFPWMSADGKEGCAYRDGGAIDDPDSSKRNYPGYNRFLATEAARLNATISRPYTVVIKGNGYTPEGCVAMTGFTIKEKTQSPTWKK